MADFKEIKTKIALKQNTYEYWTEGDGKDYIPLYGEICLCEITPVGTAGDKNNAATTAPTVLFKVGTAKKDIDGNFVADTVKKFSELNWVSALAADVYDWAKASTKPAYTASEITGIGEYIANYIDETLGITVDTNTVYQIVKVDDNTYKLQSKAAGTEAWADVNGSVITLPESTKVEASEQNGYIKVDDVEVQVFDDVFKAEENSGKAINAVGGIAANTEVNGKTFQELFYAMMFPYQNPVLSNVKASPNGGTYMKGNTQTITSVTATVTKKTSKINKVELYNGSTLVDTATTTTSGGSLENGGAVSFSVDREVSSNGGQYKVKVYDVEGKTAEANTGSFTFVNPYYYGVCAPNAEITDNVVTDLGLTYVSSLPGKPSGKNTINIDYTTNSQRMVIAYPTAYGELKSIKDGNGMENLTAFANKKTAQITNSYGYTESYYVYTNGVTSVAATMKFAFAV
jgi:hypothetical protein